MENLLDLESKFFKEGYEQGAAYGEKLGLDNGVRHGKGDGHDVGFEMGFAQGVGEICTVLFANQDESVVKAAQGLLQAVSKVPLSEPPQQQDVQRARARFKVLESRIGVTFGSTVDKSKDMTF